MFATSAAIWCCSCRLILLVVRSRDRRSSRLGNGELRSEPQSIGSDSIARHSATRRPTVTIAFALWCCRACRSSLHLCSFLEAHHRSRVAPPSRSTVLSAVWRDRAFVPVLGGDRPPHQRRPPRGVPTMPRASRHHNLATTMCWIRGCAVFRGLLDRQSLTMPSTDRSPRDSLRSFGG